MDRYETRKLPEDLSDKGKVIGPFDAPDGSKVLVLPNLKGGGAAHFQLDSGVSVAVAHRRVEEFWFFLGGKGQMWRQAPEEISGKTVEVENDLPPKKWTGSQATLCNSFCCSN